jgi:transcriptional regulator with XRE-family HTH domain
VKEADVSVAAGRHARTVGIGSPDLLSTETGTSQQTLRWLLSFRNIPFRVHFLNFQSFTTKYSCSGTGADMDKDENTIEFRASTTALAFGSLIRSRRRALKMRQNQLALATGVGRRFLIDLEGGKPSCQLGRSLLVADALGLRLTDVLASGSLSPCASETAPELPDLPEEVEEPDGQPTRIL